MKITEQKIKVHQSLHELFGRETTRLDVFVILFGSFALAFATQILCWGSELSIAKKIILAFISLDIGGGIIANFTEGTNNYYAENVKKRYVFIAIHILQPLILTWIFPNNLFPILILAGYILMSSFIVTSIKRKYIQKTVAIIMLLFSIILLFLVNLSTQALQLILLIYSIKLILAFSVNWTNSDKENE